MLFVNLLIIGIKMLTKNELQIYRFFLAQCILHTNVQTHFYPLTGVSKFFLIGGTS